MSFEDQFPYPYHEHHWLVDRVRGYQAKIDFLFSDIYTSTYCNHLMPVDPRVANERMDLYSFDVWDEGGIGDQLLPSVGDQIADYLIFMHPTEPVDHIAWRGYVWRGDTEEWTELTEWPHQFMANLHVAYEPKEDDDETGAPVCPDVSQF